MLHFEDDQWRATELLQQLLHRNLALVEEACCTGDQTTAVQRRPSGINIVDDLNVVDIEKGAPVHEHVILSVQGLTCVGCENKLFRSLDSIPAVCNLKTSLVLSQAEFDLDLCGSSVDDVIRSVERMTGFGCQTLSSKGQDIDVVVGDGAGDFITLTYPEGVSDMVVLDKQSVRITYNAKVVGARDLLERAFDTSIDWPLILYPAVAAGNRHVCETAYMTLLSAVLTIPVLVLAWAPLPPRIFHMARRP